MEAKKILIPNKKETFQEYNCMQYLFTQNLLHPKESMCSSSNTTLHCQKYLRSHQTAAVPLRYRVHASGTEEAVHVI